MLRMTGAVERIEQRQGYLALAQIVACRLAYLLVAIIIEYIILYLEA